MTPLDTTIIVIYFAATIAVGWWYRRSNRSRDDFLLGGRRMQSVPVGLSLMVSWFSAISYVALPGEIVQHGPLVLVGLAAAPLTLWILSQWIVVRLRQPIVKTERISTNYLYRYSQPVTSAYEHLERWRLAWLASSLFLLVRLFWMAMIVHITSTLFLGPMMGMPAWVPAIILLVATTIYCIGGLRAVVATDVLQAGIMFIGAGLTIWWLAPGTGPMDWPAAWPAPSWNWSPVERVTVPWAILSAVCMGLCVRSGDQMAVQRYLSVPTIGAARRVLWLSWIADLALTGLLVAVGLCLYARHQGGGDGLFPEFIRSGFPIGVTGLVVAAILAASMSSLSSGINSCVSTVAVDWRSFHPFAAGPATVLIACIVFGLSQAIPLVQGNTFELCYKVVNLLQVPLGGLMLSALFIPRASRRGLLLGTVASAAVVVWVNHFSGLSFLTAAPLGLLCQFLVVFVVRILKGGNCHGD